MPTEQYANDASTTLSGAITAGAPSLTVASATGFPGAGNFRVRIDGEILLVTAVSGTTWTVTRAAEAVAGVQAAAAHADGAIVSHVLTATSVLLAGGTPGGSTGQVQYNGGGVFAGAAGVVYVTAGNLLTLTAQQATDVPLALKAAASQSAPLLTCDSTVGEKIRLYDSGVAASSYGFAIQANQLIAYYGTGAEYVFRTGGPSGTDIVGIRDAFGVRLTAAANQIFLSGYSGTVLINNVVQVGGNPTPSSGTFGIFGATPVGQQAVGAAATDPASVLTLANNLRAALIALGFCKT